MNVRVLLLLSVSWTAGCFTDPPPGDAPGSESRQTSTQETSSSGVATTATADATTASDSTSTGAPTSSGRPPASSSGETTGGTSSSSAGAVATGEPPIERTVFLTSEGYFANLDGIAGADARCQLEAEDADLPGDFLAWISDSRTSPDERFNRDGGPWVLPNGALVATDWEDLTDGGLETPIDLDATGAPVDNPLGAWTNTNWDGTALGADCEGWLSDAFDAQGFFGDIPSEGFGEWTAFGMPTAFPCQNLFNLYCFEQ